MKGDPVTVLKSFSTGYKKVSKLRHTQSSFDTFVTSDHKFWVGDLNSISKNTLLSAGYVKHLDKQSKTVPKKC